MYVVGNVLYCFCSMFDIVFYLRLNKQWGMNDHFFVLGSSAFQTVLGTWLWMPSTVIMSQLCPKGMEATMFALLAGFQNLWIASLVSCVLPAISILLVPWFIPDKRQTE